MAPSKRTSSGPPGNLTVAGVRAERRGDRDGARARRARLAHPPLPDPRLDRASSSILRATCTFVRCGKRGCLSSNGPTTGRSAGSPATTACGLPTSTVTSVDARDLFLGPDDDGAELLFDERRLQHPRPHLAVADCGRRLLRRRCARRASGQRCVSRCPTSPPGSRRDSRSRSRRGRDRRTALRRTRRRRPRTRGRGPV